MMKNQNAGTAIIRTVRKYAETADLNMDGADISGQIWRWTRMGNDISTMFTKEQNKTQGRKGYAFWKREKVKVISPKDYGEFKNRRKQKYER